MPILGPDMNPSPATNRASFARIVLPWMVFAVGWAVESHVDMALRLEDGDVRSGGLGRELWFSIHVVLAFIALCVAVWMQRSWPLWLRVLAPVGQCALGFVLYVFACLSYGIASGIDHF